MHRAGPRQAAGHSTGGRCARSLCGVTGHGMSPYRTAACEDVCRSYGQRICWKSSRGPRCRQVLPSRTPTARGSLWAKSCSMNIRPVECMDVPRAAALRPGSAAFPGPALEGSHGSFGDDIAVTRGVRRRGELAERDTVGHPGSAPVYNLRDPNSAEVLTTTITSGGPADNDRLGWITGLAFDPTRSVLAAASLLYRTSMFNLSDPAHPVPLAQVERHKEQVHSVLFSPDGQWLASTDRVGTILLWDTRQLPVDPHSFAPVAQLNTQNRDIPVVDFSPDSRRLVSAVSAVSNRAIRVWDISHPRGPTQSLVVTGTAADPGAVLFGPGGRTVLLAVADPAIDVFAVDPESMAGELCRGGGEPITQAEWNQYLPDQPYQPPCR